MEINEEQITAEIASRIATHGVLLNEDTLQACRKIANRTVVNFERKGATKNPPKTYWDKPVYKSFVMTVVDRIAQCSLIEDDTPDGALLEEISRKVMKSKYIQDRCTATLTSLDGPSFTPVCDEFLSEVATQA